MLSFFKSSKKKAPKKGQSFYHRENVIQNIEEFSHIISHLSSNNLNVSISNIAFQGISLDKILEKNAESDFGEESFILEPDTGIKNHKVYYYRITSNHLRFLIQIHFTDGTFFFAANKVYSDALLSNNDKAKVAKQIVSKYCPDASNKAIDFNIKDSLGNVLFTKDHVFYYINYLPNNAITQALLKQFGNYKKPKSGQDINETLDRLI